MYMYSERTRKLYTDPHRASTNHTDIYAPIHSCVPFNHTRILRLFGVYSFEFRLDGGDSGNGFHLNTLYVCFWLIIFSFSSRSRKRERSDTKAHTFCGTRDALAMKQRKTPISLVDKQINIYLMRKF